MSPVIYFMQHFQESQIYDARVTRAPWGQGLMK